MMYYANWSLPRQGQCFVLQFQLVKKYTDIQFVRSYLLKAVFVRAVFREEKKTLAGFRNSLCASDAVFAQSLLSKARNHNGCWPEAYIFIYRLFPMHLVLFGSCYFLPSSSLLAWFAGVVGKCREAGSEVMQVDQLDCSFPVSGVEKALSESSMSPSQD